MQKVLSILGNFFKGFSLFLTIVHHIIWIIIGGIILFAAFYVISNGGPGTIIKQNLPAQLQQVQTNTNDQSSPSSQQNSSNNQTHQQPTQQEIQCATNIIGQATVNQLLSGANVSSSDIAKIKGCFPPGFSF